MLWHGKAFSGLVTSNGVGLLHATERRKSQAQFSTRQVRPSLRFCDVACHGLDSAARNIGRFSHFRFRDED